MVPESNSCSMQIKFLVTFCDSFSSLGQEQTGSIFHIAWIDIEAIAGSKLKLGSLSSRVNLRSLTINKDTLLLQLIPLAIRAATRHFNCRVTL